MITAVIQGAAAGVLATSAMTMTMRVLFDTLPGELRYPLPPRLLVDATIDEQAHTLSEDRARAALTTFAHVAYGAATGALYSVASSRPCVSSGVAYGLGVWTASYLGWIPAARLLRPATEHPAPRNALMLAAHVVWGASLALALERMRRDAVAQRRHRMTA